MSTFGLSLPSIFVLLVTLSVLLYLIGSAVSPKSEDTVDKLAPYACGEDLPVEQLQVNAGRFFIYVTFFLIFDISAFILATSFGGQGVAPIIFSAVVLLAAVTLLPVWRRKR